MKIGWVFLTVIFCFATLPPLVASFSISDQSIEAIWQGPSPAHWFGTDWLGRDLLVRTSYD
jgi:ABC-type dipeptide/oligopeptide/nickel transport system permease subunit